jgi:predicted phage-related endonuclease
MLQKVQESPIGRRHFIGGSDPQIIMGQDEKVLIRLWQEKRGEVGPEDLSGELIVQLDLMTNFSKEFTTERATSRASFGLDLGA